MARPGQGGRKEGEMDNTRLNAEGRITLFSPDGIRVPGFFREFTGMNSIAVSAGTTGYRGGDSGHGGRAVIKIRDLANTDIRPRVFTDMLGRKGVEIVLGGDSELLTIIEGLQFALDVLRAQIGEGQGA